MTLDDAVKALNKWRHNDIDNWRIEDGFVVGDFREYRSVFEPFDAIAIAEKLRRRAAPGQDKAPHLKFTYRNYKGVVELRRVVPTGIRFGSTEWHPKPQWLMDAYDLERNEDRTFAMRDIIVFRDTPGTRRVLRLLRDGFSVPSYDLDEALAEWLGQPNPSTETDA